MGKSENSGFSETIAACDLNLIELMKMAAMPIYGKKKHFKNLLFRSHWIDFNETLYEA